MDARDRKLLEATARGVRALLRQTTQKYRRSLKLELGELDDADKQLKSAIETQQASQYERHHVSVQLGPEHADIIGQPAADFIEEGQRSVREKALKKIIDAGQEGSTVDEICARYNLPHQTVSPRVNELVRDQQIEDSGRKRETRQGKKAIVWLWRK